MLDTIRRNWWFGFFAIGILIAAAWPNWAHAQSPSTLLLPMLSNEGISAQESKESIQIRFGHGLMRKTFGKPVSCLSGVKTDLVVPNEGAVLYGYYFHEEEIAVLPTIKKIEGKDEVYLVSFGKLDDFLLFETVDSVITATHMVDFQPVGSYDLSQPSQFLGWDISLSDNRVTIADVDSTIWITAEDQYFCNEIRTLVHPTDSGIYRDFVINKDHPKYEDNVFNSWKLTN